jgi:hypothetical protein
MDLSESKVGVWKEVGFWQVTNQPPILLDCQVLLVHEGVDRSQTEQSLVPARDLRELNGREIEVEGALQKLSGSVFGPLLDGPKARFLPRRRMAQESPDFLVPMSHSEVEARKFLRVTGRGVLQASPGTLAIGLDVHHELDDLAAVVEV